MEYGVNLSGSCRMDIAILDILEIGSIVNARMQNDDGNYLNPLIGIEFGTEKIGWDKMSGPHLRNDAQKLTLCKYGFSINVMRNTNLGRRSLGRHANKLVQVNKFKKGMIDHADQFPGICWIGLMLNLAYGDLDFLNANNDWTTFKTPDETTNLEDALVEKYRRIATPE